MTKHNIFEQNSNQKNRISTDPVPTTWGIYTKNTLSIKYNSVSIDLNYRYNY